MVTLGMMCLVITAITTLVSKVRGIAARFISIIVIFMSQEVLLDIFKTAFNRVVAHKACHFTKKETRKEKEDDRNRLH